MGAFLQSSKVLQALPILPAKLTMPSSVEVMTAPMAAAKSSSGSSSSRWAYHCSALSLRSPRSGRAAYVSSLFSDARARRSHRKATRGCPGLVGRAHGAWYCTVITGQGPGLVNVQLTVISSQYTRQLTLTLFKKRTLTTTHGRTCARHVIHMSVSVRGPFFLPTHSHCWFLLTYLLT